MASIRLTYIGGPTILIEYQGLRLLTDPTFDPAGTDYPTNIYTLHKKLSPAVGQEEIGKIHAILLSHDHHFDNLDNSGRDFLSRAEIAITTEAGAVRLGGNSKALTPWSEINLGDESRPITITGTPARHGPPHADRGPVVGFILKSDESDKVVYLSGDTVWYEGLEEIKDRFDVAVAVLFMGAACVPEVGPDHLTFTAEEGVQFARSFSNARIVPVHYEGWAHFVESRAEIDRAFNAAGLSYRLVWLEPGKPTDLEF